MLPLAAVVGAAAAVAVVIAVRFRVLRRLAVRSAVRRPGETALVVLGSMLGTAIITGSLIVGDTLDASFRRNAFTQLGPIDETVTAFGDGALERLRAALGGLEDEPGVDGVLFAERALGTVTAREGTARAAAKPNVIVLEMDFRAGRAFGGDPDATGLAGARTPAPGETALSRDLAERLDVDAGDEVRLHAYGSQRALRVTQVLDRVGLAGYQSGASSQSYNAFVAPGTIAALVGSTPPGFEASPPFALAFISNDGGVLEGADLTERVVPLVEQRLPGTMRVDDTKASLLEVAERAGSSFSSLFLAIGSFAVIAGILLLVNIFVMLAEERKGDLGMMRAVGMRRGQLVGAFVIEGFLYATLASAVGALLGIGVGAAIVRVAAGIFAGFGDFSLELALDARPRTVLLGFLIGALISFVTVVLTSIRISRINVIRAIRDLPEPGARRARRSTAVLGVLVAALGGAMLASGVSSAEPIPVLAGPALIGVGVAPLASRLMPRRVAVTVIGLAIVVWGTVAFGVFPAAFEGASETTFVVLGVLLTFSAVAVISHNQELAAGAVRRLAGSPRALAARLGLAYPLARRFRTGMTLGMYALVVFTLAFISIMSGIFGRQVDTLVRDEAGPFDLRVKSSPTSPLPAGEIARIDGVEAVAPLRYAAFTVEFELPSSGEFRPWALTGFDEALVDAGALPLSTFDEARFRSATDAWRAVLADPSLVILDSIFLREGGPGDAVAGVGDTVTGRDPLSGREQSFRVAGILRGGTGFTGPFVSVAAVESFLGPRVAPSRAYVLTADGADAAAIARHLENEHIEHGVEAETFRAIIEQHLQTDMQFFRLMQGYLALGLVIGISGLGVIMVRAVRERRRQIGVLRSLGFQPETVRWAFVAESAFVALEGTVVGAGLALLTAYQLFTNSDAFGDAPVSFLIPWLDLGILVAVTMAASLLATSWPARQASRIRPAVALRIAD